MIKTSDLMIYNTLTQSKQAFRPADPAQVTLYVCGMTVYDDCHVGHGRMFVVFDLLVRYLRFLGYGVRYVRNITDIDDKIIKRAAERGLDYQVLAASYIKSMHQDTQVLNTLTPDVEPRATDFIPQMIQMIEVLITKGMAYVGDDGDVYYSVEAFADYGQLSHQKPDQLRAGARVAANESKRDPLDFVLWKLAKPEEPHWASPWGAGRPGWHIECSAMVVDLLGKSVDIHGGGLDLQFPHHENEIAQSDAFCDCRCVNTWMHMGHVRVDAEKMSKSLGNFLTIGDVLKDYNPEVLRYFLLASHYRSPVSYSTDSLDNAHAALRRFYAALKHLPAEPSASLTLEADYQTRFLSAMNDDLNTPEALAVLFEIVREINRLIDQEQDEQEAVFNLVHTLKTLGGVLGLFWQEPAAFLHGASDQIDTADIEALITLRTQARANKDWTESDRLRDQLKSQGVILEDTAQGTTWHIAKVQVDSEK